MGKVTLYSELELNFYINAKILKYRVDCCVNTTEPPLMAKVDWFLWAYTLLELCLKKLAVNSKLGLNSKSHNAHNIFRKLFPIRDSYKNKSYVYKTFVSFLNDLGYDWDFETESEIYKALTIDFSSLRYHDKDIQEMLSLDFNLLRVTLLALSKLVLLLEVS